MLIGERIKARRIQLDMSQDELAKKVGYKSRSSINKIELDGRGLPYPKIVKIAEALRVTPQYLMGWDEDNSHTPEITEDTVVFPVIGELAAGYDMFANEEYDALDSIEIPSAYLQGRPKDDFFVLKIHGSSMYPMYMNNDKVLIKKTPTLNRSGDIGVVQYEDYATLKKVEYVDGEDWMKLIPINPSYEPKTISGSELEQCRVVGVPVLLIREIEQ